MDTHIYHAITTQSGRAMHSECMVQFLGSFDFKYIFLTRIWVQISEILFLSGHSVSLKNRNDFFGYEVVKSLFE